VLISGTFGQTVVFLVDQMQPLLAASALLADLLAEKLVAARGALVLCVAVLQLAQLSACLFARLQREDQAQHGWHVRCHHCLG